MSPDGRYAYTLYGGGDKPFVHALDTRRRSAACIDIPRIPNSAQMSLRLKGKRLTVLADGSPISLVDTATRKVWSVPNAAPPQQAAATDGSGSGTLPAWLVGGLAAAALGVAAMVGVRRRRAGAARS
jgi:hypothetical protein